MIPEDVIRLSPAQAALLAKLKQGPVVVPRRADTSVVPLASHIYSMREAEGIIAKGLATKKTDASSSYVIFEITEKGLNTNSS